MSTILYMDLALKYNFLTHYLTTLGFLCFREDTMSIQCCMDLAKDTSIMAIYIMVILETMSFKEKVFSAILRRVNGFMAALNKES